MISVLATLLSFIYSLYSTSSGPPPGLSVCFPVVGRSSVDQAVCSSVQQRTGTGTGIVLLFC